MFHVSMLNNENLDIKFFCVVDVRMDMVLGKNLGEHASELKMMKFFRLYGS